MSQSRILVVEDEPLVARDLQLRLQRMGYDVPNVATSGEEALLLIGARQPHLVLTDIRLGMGPDGIDLATMIRSAYDLPIVYLTAFTDDGTLARAQLTEPYGYVIKPFQTRELEITIEIAIFKHKIEKELRENRNLLSTILQSIGDAVIATDHNGNIVFLNPRAEILTEWKQEEAFGMSLSMVFKILMRKNFFSPWIQSSNLVNFKKDQLHETILLSKTGKECAIESTISQLKNEKDHPIGEVVVFRDVSESKSLFLPVPR